MIRRSVSEQKTPGCWLEICVIHYFFFFAEARGGKKEGASTEATGAATQGCIGTLVCDIFSTPSVLGRFAYFLLCLAIGC
jgi:hypothetical protein